MTADDLRARLRRDDRVAVVERALLASRLGLGSDDDLLDDRVVDALLALPTAVILTIEAARLLERLDVIVARAHPVDLTYHDRTADRYAATVARVPLGADGLHGVVTAALVETDPDLLLVLAVDDREAASLDVAETEALAYALLRLVAHAEEDR